LPAIIRPAFTLGGLGSGMPKVKKNFSKLLKKVSMHLLKIKS